MKPKYNNLKKISTLKYENKYKIYKNQLWKYKHYLILMFTFVIVPYFLFEKCISCIKLYNLLFHK